MERIYEIPNMDVSTMSVEDLMKSYIDKLSLYLIRSEMGGNKGIHNLSKGINMPTDPNSLRSI
jgi:hypothetical protein